MADKARDSRELDGKRDRITDWGLSRLVDDYLADNHERPDLCKNSKVAESLMKRPEVRAAIGKATIRPVDVQVYVYQRRRRQEQNADKALVDGPGGKILTNTLAERVKKFLEYGVMLDALLPDAIGVVQGLQKKALEAVKDGKDLPKDYKTSWQVMKTSTDLMMRSIDLLKGDNTLQNIIKAQTVNATIIRGIPPEELPRRMLEMLRHVQCPKCRKGDWTHQEALKAYAQAMAETSRREIVDAEHSRPSRPMPTPAEIDDDPAGEYYNGEYEARK